MKSPLEPEEQAALAGEIILRTVGILEAEGFDPAIRMGRLLAVAVAQIQMHHGTAYAASALREWADRIDPEPDTVPLSDKAD